PITPGKYLVIVEGEVADVDEAMKAGIDAAAHTLVDRLFLPQAEAQLGPAMQGAVERGKVSAIGVVETFTVASTVLAADAAAKAAGVRIVEMRLASGLGGKAFFVMTGELADVESGVTAGVAAVPGGLLVTSEI